MLIVGPSGAPLNLNVQALDASTISLAWEPPTYEHRNGPIIQYAINITNTETSAYELYSTTSLSVTVSSLHPDYTYECSVAAETSVGRGPFTIYTPIQMPEARK